MACRSPLATTAHRRAAGEAAALDVPARRRRARGGGPRRGPRCWPPGRRSRARTTRSAGSPSRSFSQPPATSSTAAAPGEVSGLNAGWSQPAVRTSAAVAASRAPPTTNPKYRGPVVATSAGSTASASSRTTIGRGGRPIGERPQASPQLVEVDAGGEHRHARPPGHGASQPWWRRRRGDHAGRSRAHPSLGVADPPREFGPATDRDPVLARPRPGPHRRTVSPCRPGHRGSGRRPAAGRAPTASPRPPVRQPWRCAGVRSGHRSR